MHADMHNAQGRMRPASATLLPVTNKGCVYDPPKMHNGKPWRTNDAHSVAEAVVAYLDYIMNEAKAFISDR
jgi:hypothetical protein